MTPPEDPKVTEAISDAQRKARELSAAIAKAEQLGAKLDLQVEKISIGARVLQQVMIYVRGFSA